MAAKTRLVETAIVASVVFKVPEDMEASEIAACIEEGYAYDGRFSPYLAAKGIKVESVYIAACSEDEISPYVPPIYEATA